MAEMKKLLLRLIFTALGLALTVVILTIPSLNGRPIEGKLGKDLDWRVERGTLYINGRGEIPDFSVSGSNKAPWYDYRKKIKSAVIEDGIAAIGDSAFEDCERMKNIHIPESVSLIGEKAFSGCAKLKSVYYGGNANDWMELLIDRQNDIFPPDVEFLYDDG